LSDFCPEILIVGNPLWETTLIYDQLPNQSNMQSRGLEAFLETALETREDTGGSAANVGVHFSQWGFQVAQVGRVGTDTPSVKARERMAHYGIHDALVKEEGRKLKTSAICRQQDEDQGYFCAWIPVRAVTPVVLEDIPSEWVFGAQWLHLDRVSELGVQLARTRHEVGKRTSLDLHMCPNRPAAQERLDAILPFLDLLQISSSAMEGLCSRWGIDCAPEALLRVLERPDHWVWATLGEKGAFGFSGNSTVVHQPTHVKNGVVDSTGAGDSFVATMIRCRLMGMSMVEALEKASLYAVSTCHGIGALGAFPLGEWKESSGH